MAVYKHRILGAFLVFCAVFPIHAEALTLSQSDKEWLADHYEEIYFAPINDYPPLLWSQYGELFGIGNDYLNLIQEKLSIAFQKVEPQTRSKILSSMYSGKKYIMVETGRTPLNDQLFIFTRSYLEIPAIYVAKSTTRARSPQDIIDKKLRVSVAEGYSTHDYLKDRYPEMILVLTENHYKTLENVTSGVTEIGALNIASLSYLTREHNFTGLKKIADVGFDVTLALAVPKSMPELRNILDNALEDISEKDRVAILHRWIPDAATVQSLAGPGQNLVSQPSSNSIEFYFIVISIILLLLLGFIIHYLLVRATPRKDGQGHNEYVP